MRFRARRRSLPIIYLLRDGDRLEIYRALKADPKQARRARVKPKIPQG